MLNIEMKPFHLERFRKKVTDNYEGFERGVDAKMDVYPSFEI
jgi:hypothetical protein